jgi:hypothetical protein
MFELKSDQPVTLGVYAATTASVSYEFVDVTNMLFSANVSVSATTMVFKVRNVGTTSANVTVTVITS